MTKSKIIFALLSFLLVFACFSNANAATNLSGGITVIPASGTVGKSVTLTAAGVDGSGKYQYKFVWQTGNWKYWGVIKDFSASNTATFIPKIAGNYQIIVDVKDVVTGQVITKSTSYSIPKDYYSSINLSTTNTAIDKAISISASGNLGSGNYQYKFVWERDGWKQWGVVQHFSAKNVAAYIPKTPGNYKIYVDVRDMTTGRISTSSQAVAVNLGWSTSLAISSPDKYIGSPITAKASVSGKADTYQYKFVWQRDGWKQWGVVQHFSSVNTATYIPKTPGNYQMIVDVRDSKGNIVTKSTNITIARGWDFTVNKNVVSTVSNANTDGVIKVNAAVSGRQGAYKYKFVWSKNNWQQWGVIQQPSPNSQITFNARTAGNYDIYVDVIDQYGSVLTKSVDFKVTTGWNVSAPTLNINALIPGQTMNISANTSGNIPGAKYKFVWSYNNWSEWGVIRNFSTTKTASFTPKKSGNYEIYVDVMDSKGNVMTASKGMTITGKYKIMVNLKTQVVSVLAQNSDGSFTHSIRNMVCSTGRVSGTTPSGTYSLKTKYRWHALNGGVWGQWCSRIVGGVLFHSVPYRSPSPSTLITKYYNNLGSPASAGCIRLRAVDAKWIYDNCPVGTTIQIGHFNYSYLPGKIGNRKIKSSTNWDPTDPTFGNPFYNKGYQ